MQIANVELEEISVDLPFNYHFDDIKPELVRSIQLNGILFPIWLVRRKDLLVVDGHKRILAAGKLGYKNIPAKIFKSAELSEVFLSAYNLNTATQPLSSIEKLKIVEIIQESDFKPIKDVILKNLGYSHIDNIAKTAGKVFDLPLDILRYLHSKNIGIKSLEILLHYSYVEYRQWYRLFIRLPFSIKDILSMLQELPEISERDGLNLEDIWKKLEIKNLLLSEYTPHQKVEKIKKEFERLRFPVLYKINSDFQNLSKTLMKNSEVDLKIQWDRTLESPEIFLNFQIREKNDLEIVKLFLLEAKNISALKKLLELREKLPQ